VCENHGRSYVRSGQERQESQDEGRNEMSETELMKAIDSASSLTDLAEIEAQINASGLPESAKERLRALVAARRRKIIKPPRG
jgi:hypothetical protein